jgi:C-methyltransferase C-terminal domain/Putative zinc binding domain
MNEIACRACRGRSGELVLDLGLQPACDYFPGNKDPGPDPVYPLQMWLCAQCGLAQLVADPTVPEEPKATEPAALVAQAADAVRKVGMAGLLSNGGTVAEYGSPHGGSWLGLLADQGLRPASDHQPADVVVDCFGIMHDADQGAAIRERASRVAHGGTLLLQYHALGTIIHQGQWNALRHGHYAYYSAIALTAMLAETGFSLRTAWHFELYGGTVLLAARRDLDTPGGPDESVRSLLAAERRVGVSDPAVLHRLQRDSRDRAEGLRRWLIAEQNAGRVVLGYGAASRAIALLCRADVGNSLLPAIVDASPAKQGRRMPGTDIPIVSSSELSERRPDSVLLFLADLRDEVRKAFPDVEATGGRWVDADTLGLPHDNTSGGLQ